MLARIQREKVVRLELLMLDIVISDVSEQLEV